MVYHIFAKTCVMLGLVVSIKHALLIVDYRLGIKHGLQTKHYRLGIKHSLGLNVAY